MARSQNGWPVVGTDKITDRAVLGVEFPNGWLRGDVDVVFTYLIGRLHREVEPIDNGGCWGYFVKNIEGSSSISNHASGTAIDYNAPAHPMGSRNTYSAADRTRIHKILDDLGGVVRWGGDYSGRPDDIHFEIDDDAAAVKRAADRIRGEDMADATVVGFSNSARDVLKAEATEGSVGYKGGGLPTWPGMPTSPNFLNAFTRLFNMVVELQGQVASLSAALAGNQSSLDSLTRDPADGTPAEAEQLPLVRAARYVADNPAPGA
jgi:hypothetical protein